MDQFKTAMPAGAVIVSEQDHIKTASLDTGTVIVTENAEGRLYLLTAEYINDILIDWLGDCNSVPANDAKVYFAAWNGEPINPHSYTDFESLIALLKEMNA